MWLEMCLQVINVSYLRFIKIDRIYFCPFSVTPSLVNNVAIRAFIWRQSTTKKRFTSWYRCYWLVPPIAITALLVYRSEGRQFRRPWDAVTGIWPMTANVNIDTCPCCQASLRWSSDLEVGRFWDVKTERYILNVCCRHRHWWLNLSSILCPPKHTSKGRPLPR